MVHQKRVELTELGKDEHPKSGQLRVFAGALLISTGPGRKLGGPQGSLKMEGCKGEQG